jgi:undecaprenyl-diphosphatase
MNPFLHATVRLPSALSTARAWIGGRSGAELGMLVALFIVAGATAGFLALVGEVMEGDTHAFDERLLRALRDSTNLSDPIGPWWVETMMRDLTALGGTAVLLLITAAAIGYLLIDGKRAAALLMVASIGGGMLVSTLLKNVFARPRPELVSHLVEVRTLSFPSGHAMLSAVTFLTLGALLAGVQARLRLKLYLLSVAILLTLLVGASRVYLGVHWPTDVLAGWCAGAGWAMLCWAGMLWLQRRGRVEGESRENGP